MNVSFEIDVNNIKHVQALSNFMLVIGGHPFESETVTSNGSGYSELLIIEPEEKLEGTKVKKAKVNHKASLEDKVSPEPIEGIIDAEGNKTTLVEEKPKTETAITLELLRTTTGPLTQNAELRTQIKDKLTSLGVISVSTLPKDKYDEFYTFLKSLKND